MKKMRMRERAKAEMLLHPQHRCRFLRRCNKLCRRRWHRRNNLLSRPIISLRPIQTPISATITKTIAIQTKTQMAQTLPREARAATGGTCVREHWMHIPRSLVPIRRDYSPGIIMLPPPPLPPTIAGPRRHNNRRATIPTSAMATSAITLEGMRNPTATAERSQFNGDNNHNNLLLQYTTILISYQSMILHHLHLIIKLPCKSQRSSNIARNPIRMPRYGHLLPRHHPTVQTPTAHRIKHLALLHRPSCRPLLRRIHPSRS
mmetsp:Transcript_6900/g.16994  ORF Transcript_6900/g.16994 Transcript_6900/m.16994 type:complete len:261 (-) Transcript_6900:2271-3053(-)